MSQSVTLHKVFFLLWNPWVNHSLMTMASWESPMISTSNLEDSTGCLSLSLLELPQLRGIPGHTQILVILVSYWVEDIPYPNINQLKFRYILRYTHSSRGYPSLFFWGGHENWTPPRSGWKITPRSISVGKVGKRLEAFKWLGSGVEVSSMAPQNMALYGTLPPF